VFYGILEWIDLSDNYLTGIIPDQLGEELENLEDLITNHNDLSGPLPRLEKTRYLSELILAENRFQGTVPSKYGHLEALRVLHFDFNPDITGTIPATFGRLTVLSTYACHVHYTRSLCA
jgi:hypothetical protein